MGFLKSLFGPPDVESLLEKGDVPGLIKAAGCGDTAVQDRALEALKGLGGAATSVLLEMTLSEKSHQRERAVELLERLGWKPASPDERTLFLVAKGTWAEVGALGDGAVPAIMRGMRGEKWDFHTRTLAAAALGFRGDAESAGALAAAYVGALLRCEAHKLQMRGIVGASKRAPDDWLAFCVVTQIALSRLGGAAVQKLAEGLSKLWAYPDTVIDVAQCLCMVGRAAVEPLTEILRDPSLRKKMDQRRMLVCLAIGLGGSGDPAAATLLSGLTPSDSDSREAVELALRTVAATGQSLIGTLGDSKPTVRMLAAAALANRGEKAAVPGLIRLLGDRHGPIQLMATVGLGKLGGPVATEALRSRLSSPGTAIKIITIMALQQIGGPAAIGALELRRSDPGVLVKSLAELAIAGLQAAN